jgi:hypothetical protein
MRTISGTLNTRQEAEVARRRLEALGIEGERLLFKEVGEPGTESIFVTVKAAPEQVEAVTDILKGGGPEAPKHEPEPERGGALRDSEPIVARPSEVVARPPETGGDRSAMPPRVDPPQPAARVERSTNGRDPQARTVPPKQVQPAPVRLARMAAIAALLAGLGFAVGAALGILA